MTDQGGLKISPDGTRCLLVVDGDVWVHRLSAGEKINITRESGRTHIYATWWPARPELIVLSSKGGVDEGPNHGPLSLVNADGSNYRVIQTDGPTAAAPPAPAPDGRTVAYDMALNGMLYDLGGEITPFDPSEYGLPEGVQVVRMGSPSWSPKGDKLAWMMAVAGGVYGQSETWEIALGVFDLRSKTMQLLHPYRAGGRGGWLQPATWSTDGQWISFGVESMDEQEHGLWVTTADGSVEQRLSPFSQSPVIWSPPGDEPWANGQALLLVLRYWNDEEEIRLVQGGTWQQALLTLPATNVIDWRALPITADPAPAISRVAEDIGNRDGEVGRQPRGSTDSC